MKRERAKDIKEAFSSRASELSYSCYDLSSLKSFPLSSFSFLVSTPFSFTLWALEDFYLSNEPLILFFPVITSFVLDGRQYLSYCQASVCT